MEIIIRNCLTLFGNSINVECYYNYCYSKDNDKDVFQCDAIVYDSFGTKNIIGGFTMECEIRDLENKVREKVKKMNFSI